MTKQLTVAEADRWRVIEGGELEVGQDGEHSRARRTEQVARQQ